MNELTKEYTIRLTFSCLSYSFKKNFPFSLMKWWGCIITVAVNVTSLQFSLTIASLSHLIRDFTFFWSGTVFAFIVYSFYLNFIALFLLCDPPDYSSNCSLEIFHNFRTLGKFLWLLPLHVLVHLLLRLGMTYWTNLR